MSDLKNEIKMIGMLSLIYGLVALICFNMPVIYHNGFGILIVMPISIAIYTPVIVIGARIITSKRMRAKKALITFVIIDSIISIYSVIGGPVPVWILGIANTALGIFIIIKIIKYNQAYENSFSTGFQYDYPAGSRQDNQGFSYMNGDNDTRKKERGNPVCRKCGKVNNPNAVFCAYCGNNSLSCE